MNKIPLSSKLPRLSVFAHKPSHVSFRVHYSTSLNSIGECYETYHTPPQISNLCNTREPVTFAAALTFASRANSHVLGAQIHAQILKLGFSRDLFSQNNLLVMYCRCQNSDHALNLFDEMAEKNLVSWTSMISGSIQNKEHEIGLELYREMTRTGFPPNEFTFASVLSACAPIEAFKFGHSLHSVAFKMGLDKNPFVGSSLVLMYSKCGNVEAAELAFECIECRDLACWNAMVEGYALNGYGHDGMRTITIMHQKGLIADRFTYISALKGCSIIGHSGFGRQIHSLVIYHEFEFSTAVMNSLADMYFKTGMKDFAMTVFRKTYEKDNISWNAAISGFAQEEDARQVVALFCDMLLTGLKPNQVTFSVVLRMCSAKDDLSLGLQFFCSAYHFGYSNDVLVGNSLVYMFSQCGLAESAYFLFNGFPSRNLITWNDMIRGYCINGYFSEAIRLFSNLVELSIETDEFTYSSVLTACHGNQHQKAAEHIHANIIKSGFESHYCVCSSLINAYASFGLVDNSYKIFKGTGAFDLVSWGAMVSAFVKQGFSSEALSLINSLREAGGEPDEFILGSALNACANVALLKQCACIHSHVIKTGYEQHSCVASAVIDAYAKCGDINSSKQAFTRISRDDDPILFNTMITAYAHHGLTLEAVELFEKMKHAALYPTHATFVAVISACSHLGQVEQGQYFFYSISSTFGMCPSKDNFACLVDLLARNGLLEKANEVIESMPYEPWPAVWRSLLSGSRIHGNREMGILAADQILHLMPNNDSAYVLLSNVYAGDGRWEAAEKVRIEMQEKGVHKVLGCSIIAT